MKGIAAPSTSDRRTNVAKSSRLAAAMTALCSSLRSRARRSSDHVGFQNTDAADVPAGPSPHDSSYCEFVTVVLERLRGCDEHSVLVDPHRAVLNIAREVAQQWPPPALAETTDTDEAPDSNALLRRAVANLDPECRAVLIVSIEEDLNYRQIAERFGLPPDEVLARLCTAYSRLCLAL
jgi:DNA-directed RNA polymerase specialized sigma24 family protein